MNEKRGSFHLYALTAIFCWSLAYPFTRMAVRHFSATSLGFLRYVIASGVLAVTAAALGIAPPERRDWWRIAASGAAGFFLYMIAFNIGSITETSATGSIVVSTAPVISALLGRALYGERLSVLQWLATAVEFAGMLVLTIMSGSLSAGAGVIWLLLAAVALSAYNLLQRGLTRIYSGLRSSIYSIFAGTVMLAVFAPGAVEQASSAPPEQLVYVAILGVFTSAAAYVSWSVAMERAPDTSSVSNYMFLTPFFATILGFLIADDHPDPGTLSGGAIILFGVFLFNMGGRRAQARPQGKRAGPVSPAR
ncbi:MAG: DMT family transporter [Synergistaceae bacterium]|jgi:drug/metabolite transporter (DMT)-like permease|nr:DMT family transporter [Synergistaceae bacterium]